MQKKEQTSNLGFQQIATLTNSTALTVPVGARVARIEAAAQAIRWRDDGTSPTTTVGMTLAAGASIDYDGELQKLHLIEAAVGGIANISYYA